jgi:hypothetical protein
MWWHIPVIPALMRQRWGLQIWSQPVLQSRPWLSLLYDICHNLPSVLVVTFVSACGPERVGLILEHCLVDSRFLIKMLIDWILIMDQIVAINIHWHVLCAEDCIEDFAYPQSPPGWLVRLALLPYILRENWSQGWETCPRSWTSQD